MIYELDINNKSIVYAGGTSSRLVYLSLITVLCVGFPVGMWFLFDGKPDDPFDPDSDHYPAIQIFLYGLTLLVWGLGFFKLRKGFKHLLIDGPNQVLTIQWQGLFREWGESRQLGSVRSFSVKRTAISEYRPGWELRVEMKNNEILKTAVFENEASAVEASECATAVLASIARES